MALSIKVDTPEIPSILKMFGLGGMPSGDTGETPPIDASLGGENAPTAAPETNALPDAGPQASPDLASTHDETKPPTKLLRLQQALGTADAAPPPPPSLQVPGPNVIPESPMPPADLAGSLAAGTARINPTFRERHPNIFKTLSAINDFVDEAGPGIGAPTWAQGWAAASNEADRKRREPIEQAQAKANLEHVQATTEQLKSQVTLPNGLTVPFALAQKLYPTLLTEQGKDTRNTQNVNSRESMAADRNAIALRKQGLKIDPATGKQVPLSRDEMSESEQATLDLKQSQQDAAAARAELDRQKNDPNSPAYKAAMGRLQVAAKNAQTAASRLGLARDTFNANYFGTGPTGEALPGAALTDNGTPVGVRVSNVTKPTNATRSKAEQAGVIKQQGEDILRQIDANPELYGVVAGRWNEFNAGKFGNASPEVRDAYTSLKSFAALQPALHGARGVGMMREFEDAVGSMANNPEALKASINSLLRTSSAFQKAGTMKTAPGGGSHPAATHVYDPSTGVIAPVGK